MKGKQIMKVLVQIYALISALLLLWFTISTIEVVAKNVRPNPQYSSMNMLVLLFEEV